MKFSTLSSPNIMYILTANQNARGIMKVYYAHYDWFNAGWVNNAVFSHSNNGYIGKCCYKEKLRSFLKKVY